MRGLRRAAALLGAAALSACAAASGPPPATDPGRSAAAGATTVTTTASALRIVVAHSRYGLFEAQTTSGATCSLRIDVPHGKLGDGPPDVLSGVAAGDGTVTWTYAAPLVPAGRARHDVRCTTAGRTGEVTSDFDVPLKTLDPRGFSVRVQAVDPIAGLAGLTTKLDPSLVPARDADVARLRATLVDEWSLATRNLGGLSLVDANADIAIDVVPGRGTSVHLLATDGTQRVLLYAADEGGTMGAENAVAVALHELGHIWCCSGPGAAPDGHWAEKVADPLLQGVDRYGLMTHPVTCLVKGAILSCPNRFSERDLRAFGFAAIPPPPPDPCVTQASALRSQLASLDASLADAQRAIDARAAQLADIQRQLDAIRAQYPSLVLPPDVYAAYNTLVARYNDLAATQRAAVDAYNAMVAQRNDVATRLNVLPC